MKTFPLFAVFLLLAGSPVALAQAPRQHSFSLSVDSTGAGGGIQSGEKTRSIATADAQVHATLAHSLTTTQNQTSSNKESVQISVRNFSAQPDTAHVEWYFVALPVRSEPGKPLSEQQFVFDQGSKDLNLAANGTEAFPAESKEITMKTSRKDQAKVGTHGKVRTNRKALGVQQTGDKIIGWMVRVVADGKTVAAKGSDQDLEDIAKDDTKLKALLSEQ